MYALDYSALHSDGSRIRKSEAMDPQKVKISEKQVRDDINENLNLYALNDLDTLDDVLEGLDIITDLSRSFRHLHVELEELLAGDYPTEYGDKVKKTLDNVRKYQSEAKAKSKRLRQEENQKNMAQVLTDKREKDLQVTKDALVAEIDVFSGKINDEIKNFNLKNSVDIQHSCQRLENLIDECYALKSKAKAIFPNFETDHKAVFDDSISKIRDQIKVGRDRIAELATQEQNALAQEKRKNDELAKKSLMKEKMSVANILVDEIDLRSKNLTSRCQITLLSGLDDYQLLELNKNIKHIDVEMREIMSKVTEVSQIVVNLGSEKNSLLRRADELRDKALRHRNAYAMELHSLVTERDICEEKLKSKDLNISLSKFSGYESKLDIYSFRTQFEKLVQPGKQKQYWVDILKRNYLSGAALTLVETVEDIDEAWEKLTNAYGNMKLLLQNKISNLDKIDSLDKLKGDEKIGNAIAKILNMMTELSTLAQKYNLNYKLYVGGGLEKILSLLGNDRERRFIKMSLEKSNKFEPRTSDSAESELCAEKEEWNNLREFLEKEHALRERFALLQKSKEGLGIKPPPKPPPKTSNTGSTVGLPCHICNQTDHVISTDFFGKNSVDYFSCKKFVDMSPKNRCAELVKHNFCLQCLRPGMKNDDDKHRCYVSYVCPDPSHASNPKGMHVLICETHKNNPANIALLKKFKEKVLPKRSSSFKDFTLNISLICVSLSIPSISMGTGFDNIIPDVRYSAIFMLQTITIDGITLRLFFDSGCGDIVVKKSAMDALKRLGRANQELPGPVSLRGVGDQKSTTDHGIYSVCLPLKDGSNVVFSGVCMDRVTMEFPKYDLREVECDIRSQCESDGGDLNALPQLPNEVGGDTDILIGAKYFYTHPREVYRSKSGLAIFDSPFLSSDGTTGVLIGPHKRFSEIEQEFHSSNPSQNLTVKSSYYAPSVIEYRNAYFEMTNNTALGNIPDDTDSLCGVDQLQALDSSSGALTVRKSPKCVKVFDEVDTAGTEVTYRCVDCRGCEKCRKSKQVDSVSMQDEIEQGIIDRSVTVDTEARKTTHLLPFVADPDARLDPVAQERLALKIYQGVIKRLDDMPAEKDAIIQSESKLHDLGYVFWLEDLPKEIQEYILTHIRYFIPWRAVFSSNSVTTPWRLVFDASASPRGQCCLNSLLAKGANNLNNMVMIMIRWLCYKYAFHTDISKMYNTIWLDKAHWRYQLYFWEGNLKVGIAPRPKVIGTAIYGVRSSGNVAECAVRKTAELTKELYPKAYDVMMDQLYVDDCMSGANSEKERSSKAEELTGALGMGGFKLKGFTFSGFDPPPNIANDDQISINVGGLLYFSKEDIYSIKVPPINFSKKRRGRKSECSAGVIPEDLSMTNCVSVVYGIFDPLGRVAPLMCGFKINITELHSRKLDWDDILPDNLRNVWKSNIEMIQEIRDIRYQRAVIPHDAVDLNCETIDTADASQAMICVAIYIRFKLKSGGYSCQLLFARTKTVPKDMTQPRAEMLAASINASTGHIVKTALGDMHSKCWKLTDSQVALFWIDSIRSKLKMWVRNHSIHINRLAPRDLWRYVKSADMPADIGTREGATIKDVSPGSPWIDGFPWMSGPESKFPMQTTSDILLCGESKRQMLNECISVEAILQDNSCQSVVCMAHDSLVPDAVGDRYKFSKYVIDPNKFRFRKVVRILGLVLLFIKKVREKTKRPELSVTVSHDNDLPSGLSLSEDSSLLTTGSDVPNFECTKGLIVDLPKNMISAALQYFFRSATDEVKHFLPASKYKHITEEKLGILYYTGRILPTQGVTCSERTMCDVCLDLMTSTFCVPVVDALSPIAYSLADEIHWYHPDVQHGGIESALRETNRVAFIIGGRELLKTMKHACARCRFLHKQDVKVAMGPKHESNLCIAPAFFNTQVDLCGPFDSYSNVNKRAKVKIYLVVFCCSTTGATDIKVMEDYSTDAFIMAFIRFSCRYGYPSTLYPDPGSQLLKGCKDMVLSFSTIRYKLEVEFGVQFFTCPVGSHYFHGKVERKIREVKKSIEKHLLNQRFSILQWETLGQQIANSVNNLPIGLANKTQDLENLDLLTPNRLLLGRNNNRCPTAPLILSGDIKKIIQSNNEIFRVWFKSWLISYVPTLVPRPKWFETGRHIALGDVVLFSKSDKEFEHLYQFGIVTKLHTSGDGLIRSVDISYQNHSENVKRITTRGVRELTVIHPVEQLGISKELHDLSNKSSNLSCYCSN